MRYNALLGWLFGVSFSVLVIVLLLTSDSDDSMTKAHEPVGRASFGLSAMGTERSDVYIVPDTSDGDYRSVEAPDRKPVAAYVPGKADDSTEPRRSVQAPSTPSTVEHRPVARDDGKLLAEDGTWVDPDFNDSASEGHTAEDGTRVNDQFYDSMPDHLKDGSDDRKACRGESGSDEGDDNGNGWINPGESGYARLCG